MRLVCGEIKLKLHWKGNNKDAADLERQTCAMTEGAEKEQNYGRKKLEEKEGRPVNRYSLLRLKMGRAGQSTWAIVSAITGPWIHSRQKNYIK